jgi:hypothetical protein
MFAYPDAARYRLGINYQQLPTNRAVSAVYAPYQRDGLMNFGDNYGADPNYVRSSLRPIHFQGKVGANGYAAGGHEEWVGAVSGFTTEVTDEDFVQPKMFWDMLAPQPGQQEHFVYNVTQHLKGAIPAVQEKTFGELFSLGAVSFPALHEADSPSYSAFWRALGGQALSVQGPNAKICNMLISGPSRNVLSGRPCPRGEGAPVGARCHHSLVRKRRDPLSRQLPPRKQPIEVSGGFG